MEGKVKREWAWSGVGDGKSHAWRAAVIDATLLFFDTALPICGAPFSTGYVPRAMVSDPQCFRCIALTHSEQL